MKESQRCLVMLWGWAETSLWGWEAFLHQVWGNCSSFMVLFASRSSHQAVPSDPRAWLELQDSPRGCSPWMHLLPAVLVAPLKPGRTDGQWHLLVTKEHYGFR